MASDIQWVCRYLANAVAKVCDEQTIVGLVNGLTTCHEGRPEIPEMEQRLADIFLQDLCQLAPHAKQEAVQSWDDDADDAEIERASQYRGEGYFNRLPDNRPPDDSDDTQDVDRPPDD